MGDIGVVLAMIKIIEEFGGLEYSTVGSILSDPGYINQEGLTIISLW